MSKEQRDVPKLRFPGYDGEWEQHKFGEITEIKSASRVHRDEWTTAGVPFYRSSDVMSALNGTDNTKAYISEELYEKLTLVSGKLEQGDILVTGGGSVGNPYKVPNNEPLYTKDADLLWVKRSKWLHPDFVYQYFLSPVFRDYLSSISHVGTIAHYTITQLENTPISLPRIEEQLQIGQFLTNLDTLITLQQRKLDQIKEYKKGMLQKMFPKEGETVPEVRFPGFDGEWKLRKLGDISDVTKLAGFEFTKYVVYSDEGDIIALRGLNIKDGHLVLNDVKYIDLSDFSKLSRSKLYKNDIMFTYVGTLGEVALIPDNNRFYLAPNVSRIRVTSEDNPQFICQYMRKRDFYEKVIQPLVATSSQPALSMENIRKFIIALPPKPLEQIKLAQFFDGLDALISLHQRKLEAMKEYKKGLLQQMFV